MNFIANIRVLFSAPDEATASLIAETLNERISGELDDESDESWVASVISPDVQDLTPEEILDRLRVARNVLIRTRSRVCFDLARSLDQVIYMISTGGLESRNLAGYDYSGLLELAEAILVRGEDPVDG